MKRIALALLIATGAAPALAANVVVGWKDLSFTLQDLDPADGIAPSLENWFSSECAREYCNYYVDPTYQPPSAFSLTHTVQLGQFAPLDGNFQENTFGFQLSPSTLLTVTGVLYSDGTGHEHAVEDLGWAIAVNDADAWGDVGAGLEGQTVELVSGVGYQEMPFSFTFESAAGSNPTRGEFDVAGRVQSYSFQLFEPPPAIPEPQTWLLMVAGTGLLSFVARRRRG